ncbi:CARDB domain-containing protein [Streptomyces sp. NPDC090021]|uniref:CARDB domain-containing protein n=1 Tax=Streptomyces sp. NPDC090021 TaxID=3365919 RepID=UPI00380460AF
MTKTNRRRPRRSAVAGVATAALASLTFQYAAPGSAAAAGGAASAPTLENGDFEDKKAEYAQPFDGAGGLPGWKGGGCSGAVVPSKMTDVWPEAASGDQFVGLATCIEGSVSQTVDTEPGTRYVWRATQQSGSYMTRNWIGLGDGSKSDGSHERVIPLNGRVGEPLFGGQDGWKEYYGVYQIPEGQTKTTFHFGTENLRTSYLDNLRFEPEPHVTGSTSAPAVVHTDSTFQVTTDLSHVKGEDLHDAVYRVALPTGVEYVADSVRVGGQGVGARAKVENGVLTVRLGSGANDGAGGTTQAGDRHSVTYSLKVAGAAPGADFTIAPELTYQWQPIPDRQTTKPEALGTTRVLLATTDLALEGAFAAKPVAGKDVDFTVKVHNNGPGAQEAAKTRLVLELPDGLANVRTTSGQECAPAGAGGVACDLGNIAAGTTHEVRFTGSVADDWKAGTPLSVTATVSTTSAESDTTNNRQSFTDAVEHEADLAVSMQLLGGGQVKPGEELSYEVIVKNAGPSPARDVVVANTVRAEGIHATPGTGTFQHSPTGGTWRIPELPKNGTAKLTLLGKAPADQNDLHHTASALTATPESKRDDNAAALGTKVAQEAALKVAVVANKADARPGEVVEYTVTLKNEGLSKAHDVVVTDTLPEGMVRLATETAAGTFDADTGSWRIPELKGQGTAKLIVKGTAPADRNTLVYTATVTGSATKDRYDEDGPGTGEPAQNHRSTATTTVQQAADLTVALTPPADPVKEGGTGTVRVIVTNNGPSTAHQAKVVIGLPGNVTDVKTGKDSGFTADTGTWTVGDLPSGGSKDLSIDFRASGPEELYFDVLELTSRTPDPVPCDGVVCESITVPVEAGQGGEEPPPSEEPTPAEDPGTDHADPGAPTGGNDGAGSPESGGDAPSDTTTSDAADGGATGGVLASTGSQVIALAGIAAASLAAGAGVLVWRRRRASAD